MTTVVVSGGVSLCCLFSVSITYFKYQLLSTLFFIDVKDIKFVINYDFPGTVEDYVHRIGRTGRANTYGTSISYFTADNYKLAKELVAVLREANQEIDPKLLEMARPRQGYGGSGGGSSNTASRYGIGGSNRSSGRRW